MVIDLHCYINDCLQCQFLSQKQDIELIRKEGVGERQRGGGYQRQCESMRVTERGNLPLTSWYGTDI